MALPEKLKHLEGNLLDLFIELNQEFLESKIKMKTISVNIPKIFEDKMEVLVFFGLFSNRSEVIRTAIRDFLEREYKNLDTYTLFKKALREPKKYEFALKDIAERLKGSCIDY